MTDWTQAEVNALMVVQIADAIRERDAAIRELALCWCVATESSPDDALSPFPAGMAYKAVDAMQDREYAAEGQRDAALAILQAFVDAEETAKTSSTKSFGEYVDAIDRARKLLAKP
jgi:hypothetical protein